MMDILEARTLGKGPNHITKQIIPNVSRLPQLCEVDLHQDVRQQGDSGEWYKELSGLNDFISYGFAKNPVQKKNLEWGQRTSGHVPDLHTQLSTDGASVDFTNQKILLRQFEKMIHHEITDASFSSQELAHCVASSCGDSNAPYPLVDYSMVCSTDCNPSWTNNASDSSFFGDRSLSTSNGFSSNGHNQGAETAFKTFERTGMLSPVSFGHVVSEMVPSPEQISCVTACSDADLSSDTGVFDGGRAFPGNSLQYLSGSSSENCFHQKNHTEGFPSLVGEKLEFPFPLLHNLQQDPQMIPEAPGVFRRAIFDVPIAIREDFSEHKLLMPGFQQFHQQHQRDESSEAQSQYYWLEADERFNKLTGQMDSEVSYLPTKQSLQLVSSEISPILRDSAEATLSSDLTSQQVLFSYVNHKRKDVDGSLVSFVKHMHSTVCNYSSCNCDQYRLLVSHFENCCGECNLCSPVRKSCFSGRPPLGSSKHENGHSRAFCYRDFGGSSSDTSECISPPLKRLKMGNPVSFEVEVSDLVASSKTQSCESDQLLHLQQWRGAPISNNLNATEVNMGVFTPLQESTSTSSTRNNGTETAEISNLESPPVYPEELIGHSAKEETVPMCTSEVGNNITGNFRNLNSCTVSVSSEELTFDCEKEEREVGNYFDKAKLERENDLIAVATDSVEELNEHNPMGASLIDSFTEEELKEHLSSLRQSSGQEIKGNAMTQSSSESSCQLCAMGKLLFALTPIYCSSCGIRIKRSLCYYSTLEMDTRHCFCTLCFKVSRGDYISFHGISISKAKLHKEKNNHEDEESWVLCDRCGGWQHQICALYNKKRDLGGRADYVCPKCYLKGIEAGEHIPLKTLVFGAKELPTTKLSDYIEQRLFRRLKQDREERAKALQKKLDEVPGATDLVVRVVLSSNKLLNVKPQFLDIFHDDNYPTEFPYRSKVVLLFQKIEGVDVCLFGMYVQEFGSECGPPNQRCVYISYLDSVKFFRTDIKTASGEALRTFVYHEILIGYLDYCKKRGFATCYIWACPPLKGEDYILYCHPETQKTPKSDKLRHWYKLMLRKAAKENIVADCTNFYDHYFIPTRESNIKITAARLPYFDGDYWSGAALDIIKSIEQGSRVGSQSKVKKCLTKRTLKAMGHADLSGDATKDVLLMQKLGQSILPVKEDFLMVRLQYTCTRCHEPILSGSQWVCNECKSFQICESCYDVEHNFNERNIHTSTSGEKHVISQVAVNDVPANTDDSDAIIDNCCFENRHSFLNFCQVNHYQFDTLRRAKHSSMMILYHLHSSSKPSVEASCCICHQDIVVNQGWHCEICPGFNACDGCYQRKGGDCHSHKLNQRSAIVNRGSMNGRAQQQNHRLMRKALDVVMHVSQCSVFKFNTCSYPHCIKMKKLFLHTSACNVQVAGGCQSCRKTWLLLRAHSKNCTDSNCRVPRCMDLKKRAEMVALQSETRRRAAVLEPLTGFEEDTLQEDHLQKPFLYSQTQ